MKRKNRKYKLIMFDIDGVLNKHGDNIQNTSKEAIRILRRQGIMVCFASGKHAWYIQGGLIWSGLLRQDTLIVAENGGVIYKPSTRKTILEDKYIQDVQLLRSIFYNLYSKDEGFLNFAGLTVWEEPKETLFCLYPKDAKDVQRLAEILEEIVKVNRLNLYLVENPDSVDVLQKGINKSTGLKHICDWLGVDFDEIIAVGDSYNDIEMLKDVGFGITLENGKPEVKKVVKFKRGRGLITKNSYGEGVLEAVKCLINKRII